MIRVVALDVMDTVVRDPFREALEAATGLSAREVFARRDPGAYPSFERGEIDEPTYWRAYRDAGITVDVDAFHRARRDGIAWLPGMKALLDELDGLVVRVTASNYPVWIEELSAEHLVDHFDLIVASCHLGVRKPDVTFYRRLLDRLGCACDEVLFSDDRPENVAAAESMGIRSHRFTGAPALRRWLADSGVTIASD